MTSDQRHMSLREFLETQPNGTRIVVDEIPSPEDPTDTAVIAERVMSAEEVGVMYRVLTETRTLLIPLDSMVVVVLDE